MPRKLIFATHNKDKVREIKKELPGHFELISLEDLNFREDIPETAPDITGNALIKVNAVYDRFKLDCFADDTGLSVSALHGAPGVYSARYAGDGATDADNVRKLLRQMRDVNDRSARFATVIALKMDGRDYFFEGITDGEITTVPRGEDGFGYDPVFVPDGYSKTYAEMSLEQKNSISHRGKAVREMIAFLKDH